ncbi:MAG TPA: 16S rRNA (guanine(527)-N(7))-methyltransferase RsmG [Xanthobacteraceae bacterium]|nr:16S rRNA (guanine(527)-N(7))-methyltransferase RsmG [Xanthobacteraceae bacterium]
MNAQDQSVAIAADRARAQELVAVSRETLARLDRLVELLLEWQQTRNLIAASTIPTIWTRHIADSLQLLELAPGAKLWVDLGSGGGFPGLVLACALSERAGATIHLVESTAKKCAFLQTVADDLRLPAKVHCQRVESFIPAFPSRPDVVTARALAPLPKLLDMAFPLLKRGGLGLFLKGQDVASELTEASKCWNIRYKLVPSRTDDRARIVVVERLESRKTATKPRRSAR